MSLRLTSVLLAAAMLGACGEETDIPSGVDFTDDFGRIRFVNAIDDSANADRVDVLVDGVPLGVSLAYGAVTPTGAATYYTAYEGSRQFLVQRTASPAVTVLDEAVTVTADTSQTVYGVLDGTFVTLDNTVLPAGDSLKLRIVHLAPSAGNVDVYVTVPGASLATIAPTVADVSPRSASAYLTLGRRAYQVRFTPAGTKTVVLTATVTAPAGVAPYIRTVVALDPQVGTALTSAVLTDR
ncbi:MAG: DUF4397 domain-containing protein [Gemmatimonadota bacterium]|nr:DUF4397 domain-containing protein [Gemmatimonadota bacterium]